jgi:hypothetical protein
VVLQTREPASPAESSVRAGLVLERVWESYQALAVHRHLRIEWPAGNAISCRAAIDAANLELLIENMIGEALASAQPETVVRPVARRRNGNIEIEVCYSPETARPDGVEIGTCRAIAKRFNGQFHKGENELRVELPESVA